MKKRFAFLLSGIIVLMALTFTLQILFNNQTKNFGISSGALFLSIFCLFEYKNALTPSEKGLGAPINRTKKYYERKGELHKYQSLCKVLFIATIVIAALTLMRGLGEIFMIYIKSVVAN